MKNNYKTPQGFKEVKCRKCQNHIVKISADSLGGTCFRCVAKDLNPKSVMVTDLSPEEYNEFIQRMIEYGRSKNDSIESPV